MVPEIIYTTLLFTHLNKGKPVGSLANSAITM